MKKRRVLYLAAVVLLASALLFACSGGGINGRYTQKISNKFHIYTYWLILKNGNFTFETYDQPTDHEGNLSGDEFLSDLISGTYEIVDGVIRLTDTEKNPYSATKEGRTISLSIRGKGNFVLTKK